MGLLYRQGEGVRRNRVTALRYFLMAGSEEDEDAQIQCEFLQAEMTDEQQKRALATALRWRLKRELESTMRDFFDTPGFFPPGHEERPADDPGLDYVMCEPDSQ